MIRISDFNVPGLNLGGVGLALTPTSQPSAVDT
jgi:hypothetical protein